MAVVIPDLSSEVEVPVNGTLSRVLHQDDRTRLVLFAFDTGQELTQHRSASSAIVQVISGRLKFTASDETHDLKPGGWLYMSSGEDHALEAIEPTLMLLTLLRG